MRVLPLATACLSTVLLLSTLGCSDDSDAGPSEPSAPNTTAAPEAVAMVTVGGLKVPSSRTDGPARTDPPQGYSHSPQGAALAAAQGQAALATAPDNRWAETVRTVTAPGPGRDEYAYARSMMTVKGAVGPENASTFSGFKITHYSDDQAIIALATTSPARDGRTLLTGYPVELAWTGGDWKLVLPKQADGIDAAELPNLDGYTTWTSEAPR